MSIAVSDPSALFEHLADKLAQASVDRRPIAPLSASYNALTLDHAYAVQEILTRRRLNAGARLVGRKIGLTSPAVQKQLGVDQPDYGMLFADMQIENGAAVPPGALIQPRIEGEVAFIMGRELSVGTVDEARFAKAAAYMCAALEIVDSRIEAWKIGIVDTVADNASSARFVLSDDRVAIGALDPREVTMNLRRDGEIVSSGSGRACLGNPLTAAAWLAEKMIALGRPLQRGDIVLSGALGPMVSLEAGRRYELEVSGLGTVSVIG
jgi:2-keto-4-pentenoate hydratase